MIPIDKILHLDYTQTDNPFTIDNVSLKKVLFP